MSSFIRSSRKTWAFLALLFLVLAALSGWVVTAPEFGGSANQTIIGRWESAISSRLAQARNILQQSRPKSESNAKKSSAEKAAEISGPASVLVLDNRNQPIRDVALTFRPTTGGGSVSQKTDSQGRIQTKLPVGVYQLAFTHPKYSTEVRSEQQVYGPLRGISISVVMQTRVLVKGTVVDEEGKPVPGASVAGQRNWLQQFAGTGRVFLDDAAYPTVVADAKGAFQMSDVSIGNNTITASRPGYARAESRLEVPAGGLATPLKLVLKRPAHITGRVVDEEMTLAKDVKVTAVSFQPFGATAAALPASGFSALTDDQGRFKLQKLFADGYYHLRFEHPAYAIMELSHVTAGTDNLSMTMQRGGEVSGRVAYLDRPSTAAHVLMRATTGGATSFQPGNDLPPTTITRSAMSRASGDFIIPKLPYGSYDLSVNYEGFVNEPRAKVTSARDKPSTNNLVEIYEASHLAGRVVDAASGNELPGADVVVKATYGFGTQRTRQFNRKADATGRFSFDNLPGGIHQVTAKADGYLPTSGNVADYTVPLAAGAKLDDYTVFLSKGGVVKGQVVSADGQGIGESEVQLFVASGSFNGLNVKDLNMTTDGGGFFEFRDFPIGQRLSLYVSARKEGYAKKHSELVELFPDQPEIATQVIMTPGGVISGKVTDTQGTPIYGVKVTFDSREFPGDPSPSEFFTFTDSAGNYLIERCTPGRATLVAERDDYVRQIKSSTILEGRLLSRQNFKMQLSRNIQGTVADFNGNPIAAATVTAAPLPKSTGSGRVTTDKKGDFLLDDLGIGRFRVEASFTLDTPDGKQAYTFIKPEVPVGAVGVPVDCDIAPSAYGKIMGREGKGVDVFTLTLRSRLDTEPKQEFRFNLERQYKAANGDFRLLQVPRGLYNLKVEAPGYETWESEEVIVGPGNRTRLPTIRMNVASQILGTVISSTTGKPVQGALVRVLDDGKKDTETVNRIELAGYERTDIIEYLDAAYDDDFKYDPDPLTRLVARVRANVVTTRNTNVYGKFDIDDLAAGTYTIEIEHPMFRPKRIRNITVARDSESDVGQVEMEPGGIVRGRVVDLEGNGILNASVQIKGELQGRNRSRTDVAGNFVMRGIANGDWPVTVLATLNGRKVYAWKKISVRPDETSLVEFVLETSANLRGRVTLPGGVAQSGTVRLYVVDETGTVMDDISYTSTIKNGNYSIADIPPGRYFTLVDGKGAKGGFAIWRWVDVNRGSNTDNLSGISATMGGTANDVVSGEIVRGAQVQAAVDVTGVIVPQSIQNQLRLADSTDAAGRFTFPYLQPGTHRIWAGGPGRQIIPVDAIAIGAGQDIKDYKVAVQVDP